VKSLDRAMLVVVALGVLAALIAAAGFVLAVEPQRSKAASVQHQIAAAEVQLTSLHAGGPHGPSIRAAQLYQLAQAMPDEPDLPGVLLDLGRQADTSRVALVGITPLTTATLSDGSTAIPLTVTVNGSWAGITAFLRAMRDQVQVHGKRLSVTGRIFDVDKVQIQSGQTGGTPGAPNAGQIQAILTMNAFAYGAPGSGAASTTGTTTTGTTTTTTTTPSSAEAAGAAG
jgi:hypothetical protein